MNKLQPLYEGEQIKELIPQRNPIIMVDTFYDATDVECHTGLTIKYDNLFCENGNFIEPGLIEHIAQSASAFAGHKAKVNNMPTPVGFIGEIKKFKLGHCPKCGDKLFTTIRTISEVMNVSLIATETQVNGEVVADCQMKIYIKE